MSATTAPATTYPVPDWTLDVSIGGEPVAGDAEPVAEMPYDAFRVS